MAVTRLFRLSASKADGFWSVRLPEAIPAGAVVAFFDHPVDGPVCEAYTGVHDRSDFGTAVPSTRVRLVSGKDASLRGARCPNCGGPVTTETFSEATITTGPCGYSWAAHFGGGEVQTKPCGAVSRAR